jgi:hypothetical protein
LQRTCGLCQLVIYQRNHRKYTNELSDVNIVVYGLCYKMSLDKNSYLLSIRCTNNRANSFSAIRI